MEELSSKKNTDCVYFLASPLTCKKGMQCEFRHSEAARLNPRDCWYWLSGNCLNPDCAFRHPPLDAGQEEVPNVETPAAKGRVPCYFYAQGYCAKGDKCAFMHGYSLYNNQAQGHGQQPTVGTAARNVPKTSTTQATVAKTATNPSRETVTQVTSHISEEEKRVESQVECSSPDDYQLQERDEAIGGVEDMVDDREMDWPATRGSSADIDEPAASEEFYDDDSCEDDATFFNPENDEQPVGRIESLHRAEPGYDCGGWHVENNSFRDRYSDLRSLDPPYHPSAPYDCMLNPRQGLMQGNGIDTDLESLFNLGMNRRRLEDRLIFPRNNAMNNFSRLRLFQTNGDMNVHTRHEVQPSLYGGHGVRPRQPQLNLRRLANGGILSRLGAPRSSIKSRLRFTNNRRQQQRQHQRQHNYHHHHHRQYAKNARYLGIIQQQHLRQVNKVSKRTSKYNTGYSTSGSNNSVKVEFPSQFDGPKSLAELKAAKLVDS